MASKITITFANDNIVGNINFKITHIANGFFSYKPEEFGNFPRSSYKIPTQGTSSPLGASSAYVYSYYWGLDYNIGNFVIITQFNNVVVFEMAPGAPALKLIFEDFTSDDPNVSAIIENTAISAFTIDDVVYNNAVNPCTHVETSITTSEVIAEIWLDNVKIEDANVNNPYVIELTKGIKHKFKFVNASGFEIQYPTSSSYIKFEVLGVGNINYSVTPSVNGATLNIQYIHALDLNPALDLEYSLNDIDWQTSNIFTGQGTGAGTIYIRDQFGCKISKNYTITDSGSRPPYLFISKANSIPFAEYQEWDDCSIHKNNDNTLAYQGLEEQKYCENVLFQLCDITTIQIKSNYDTPSAVLRHEDGTIDNLDLHKRTSNLNRYKQMDAVYYKYADGLLGLYFDAGNTYDELSIVNGTYTLNGNLPEFAILGQYININGLGIFKIFDIIVDDIINKKVIIIDYIYNGAPTSTRVESLYDLLPFEIYEFIIDWSLYNEGIYDILIDNTDSYNGTVQHVSENIWIKEKHKNTLAIKYFNKNNRDIFYKYGIEHFIRVLYLHIERIVIEETKISIGDLTSNVTESTLNEGNKFYLDECVSSIMVRNCIALSCENLFINNDGYVKNDKLDVENIYNTNLYKIDALLFKTNISYNNNKQGQQGIDEGAIEFDIPSFIFGDGGFIKS
jgi:hypothetical protein